MTSISDFSIFVSWYKLVYFFTFFKFQKRVIFTFIVVYYSLSPRIEIKITIYLSSMYFIKQKETLL